VLAATLVTVIIAVVLTISFVLASYQNVEPEDRCSWHCQMVYLLAKIPIFAFL
jgi:hypothetical protein